MHGQRLDEGSHHNLLVALTTPAFLPAEVKEEDSPPLLKKWRARTHNEGGGDCRAGWFLQSSSVPMAYDYSRKILLMPQDLMVCTTNTALGPILRYLCC